MRIELLYFDGCPNHEALLPHLRDLLPTAGVDDEVQLVRVEDPGAAQRHRFLGSPTVRIEGEDVEPSARERSDFGLKCRLFTGPDGLRGTPPDDWVLAAIARARNIAT
jgi:hypothetical protein